MGSVKDLLKISGYSDKAIEYYVNRVHVGSIEKPDASYAFTGPCGDTMEFFLKITSKYTIIDAKFQAIGCAGSFAFGSAIVEMIIGKSLGEAEMLDEKELVAHLGEMPLRKVHCAGLAISTLRKAIEQYKTKTGVQG